MLVLIIYRDVIAGVNTASEHLLHEILGFIESMLVLII